MAAFEGTAEAGLAPEQGIVSSPGVQQPDADPGSQIHTELHKNVSDVFDNAVSLRQMKHSHLEAGPGQQPPSEEIQLATGSRNGTL